MSHCNTCYGRKDVFMDKQKLIQIIEAKKEKYIEVNDLIWEHAEVGFKETKSAKALMDVLNSEGFEIEASIADMPTAFVASYGTGKPVVGILAEYDALSGISQHKGLAEKKEVTEDGNGHGCGHNVLGAGALAAAVAVKDFMEESDLKGTIRLYGCPAEEGGAGKTFMVRDGVFDDVDAAISWHPGTNNAIWNTSTLACLGYFFRFKGVSSHAAASPHLGRSALDAVELMNVGINYLREHVVPEARIHYAITNAGGKSPNVVQPEAEVHYFVRAPKMPQAQEIFERVCKVARGAAMMTETELEIVFDDALSNVIPNDTLGRIMHENMQVVGAPAFSDVDRAFASEISATLTPEDKGQDMMLVKLLACDEADEIIAELRRKPLAEMVLPYNLPNFTMPGSTDVGDVSWVVPTTQCLMACGAVGTPAHSWQQVSQSASGIAHKGVLAAGKVMAMTAADILMNPSIADKAKDELTKRLEGDRYVSPIPEGVKPNVDRD